MTGQTLYDMYRAERLKQGWDEWKWESLNKPQQLVWTRLAATLAEQRAAPAQPQPAEIRKIF